MFARGRRQQSPLVLVRLRLDANRPSERALILLTKVASDLRLTDLAWWDGARAAVFLLLEGGADAEAPLRRWRAWAAELGMPAPAQAVSFPLHGVTLAALLEALT